MSDSVFIRHLPDWYLEWCWGNSDLQKWWQHSWNTPGGPIGTNVNVGDRFTHQRTRQTSVVYAKIITGRRVGEPSMIESFMQYNIGGDRGGHWYAPSHAMLIENLFLFLPTAEQLVLLGYRDVAERLLNDVKVPT